MDKQKLIAYNKRIIISSQSSSHGKMALVKMMVITMVMTVEEPVEEAFEESVVVVVVVVVVVGLVVGLVVVVMEEEAVVTQSHVVGKTGLSSSSNWLLG